MNNARVTRIDKNHLVFNGKVYGMYRGERYYKRGMRCNGKYRSVYLHREVWEYYHGEIPKGMMVDHIDRDRENNNIENLRLVTPKENRANVDPSVNEMHRRRMIEFNSQEYGKWWQNDEIRKQRAEKLSKNWANRPLLRKVCKNCGKTFYAKHPVAVYCSSACRQEGYFKKGVKIWQRKRHTR